MNRTVTALIMSLMAVTAQADDKTLKAEVKASVASAEQAVSMPSASAAAVSAHICTNGSNTRRVELTGSSPCEVHYKKETEKPGHDQVLWTAKNDQKYCEIKAQAFVEKLTGMGWKCDKG